MKRQNRLGRQLARWAIPNLTTTLIAGQVLLYVLQALRGGQGWNGNIFERIVLLPSAVMAGEVWRLVTFLFVPPPTSPLLIIFFWLLFYWFGTALEQEWGTARYNSYLLIGYLASVAAVFIAWGLGADMLASNTFLYGTVFLAFAHLFPNFVINVFFILPVQIKWLAMLAWISYGYTFLSGDSMTKMIVLASVANYLVFFSRDHWRTFRGRQRRRAFQARTEAASKQLTHQCRVCGLDSKTSPKTLFRYCSKCDGQCCYCPEHIHDHTHVRSDSSNMAGVS